MIQSTDKTIEADINQFLKQKKIVLVICGSNCKNCKTTKKNIETFEKENPSSNLAIIGMDSTTEDKIESSYYQIHEMNEYPKSVVYHRRMDSISFVEGVVSTHKLKELSNSLRNC